ncbi:MAG TPA: MaoC family dehydratase [Candidatus Cloacimonadota bacterium]|jgi:acyl dehydratase|nr:MaoC family dehydratase [Candidatus Cloacimonadota bacterium]
MNPSVMGHYFEEFEAGQVIEHQLSKTIFESDNNFFSLLTMNHHPLHTNRDFAEKSQHKQNLVVGTLVFSIVVGMTVPDISGKAIANLDFEKVEHLAPVFINDTLYAKTEILDIRESKSKPDRGIVYVETTASNQDGIAVLRYRRHVLIAKKGE